MYVSTATTTTIKIKRVKKTVNTHRALFVPRCTFCYEDSDRYVTSMANTSITCACHVNAMQVVIFFLVVFFPASAAVFVHFTSAQNARAGR